MINPNFLQRETREVVDKLIENGSVETKVLRYSVGAKEPQLEFQFWLLLQPWPQQRDELLWNCSGKKHVRKQELQQLGKWFSGHWRPGRFSDDDFFFFFSLFSICKFCCVLIDCVTTLLHVLEIKQMLAVGPSSGIPE